MVRSQVLIIDRNATHQRLAVLMAQREGYAPHVVTSAETALETLDHNDQIKIVLVDLDTPHSAEAQNCLSALNRYRKLRRRSIALIASSAYAMAEDLAKDLALGADDCLPKPYTSRQFHEMLNKWNNNEEHLRLAS